MEASVLLYILSILVLVGFGFFLITFRTEAFSPVAWMLRLLVISEMFRAASFIISIPANPEVAIYRNLVGYIAYLFMLFLYIKTRYKEKK